MWPMGQTGRYRARKNKSREIPSTYFFFDPKFIWASHFNWMRRLDMGYNIRWKLSSLPFHWQRAVFCLTVIEHTRTARIRATHWHTVCDGRTKHGCSKVSICRRAFKQKKWNANGLPITVTTLCPLVGGTVYGALKTVHTKSGRSFLYKENPPDSKWTRSAPSGSGPLSIPNGE